MDGLIRVSGVGLVSCFIILTLNYQEVNPACILEQQRVVVSIS
jgi:hypothetical protein